MAALAQRIRRQGGRLPSLHARPGKPPPTQTPWWMLVIELADRMPGGGFVLFVVVPAVLLLALWKLAELVGIL
jgi:hypothetical protein